jgi:hypothetical protein
MTVRELNGSSDNIAFSIGTLKDMAYGTFVVVFRLSSVTGPRTLLAQETDSTNRCRLFMSNNEVALWNGTDYRTAGSLSTDVWYLLVLRKGSGSVTPRMSLYNYDTMSWTNSNLSGTLANWTSPGTSGSMDLKSVFNEYFSGRIAAIGVWANRLPWAADFTGDLQVVLAAPEVSLSNWPAPDALMVFGQSSTATPVQDATGGGANQSSISGTSVITEDDPPGLDLTTPDYLLVEYNFNQFEEEAALDSSGNSNDLPAEHTTQSWSSNAKYGGSAAAGYYGGIVGNLPRGAFNGTVGPNRASVKVTLMCWVYIPDAAGSIQFRVAPTTNETILASIAKDSFFFFADVGSGYVDFHGLAYNTWHHFAFQLSATALTVFINGELFNTTAPGNGASSVATGSSDSSLAYVPTSGIGNGWAADDYRLYERAFTEAEVTALMNAPAGQAEDIEATGAVTLPAMTIEGTADTGLISGTATMTLPEMTVASDAGIANLAGTAISLPAMGVAAQAEQATGASGTVQLPEMTSTAAAQLSAQGAGDIRLPGMVVAATAQSEVLPGLDISVAVAEVRVKELVAVGDGRQRNQVEASEEARTPWEVDEVRAGWDVASVLQERS